MQSVIKTALIFAGGNCEYTDFIDSVLPRDAYVICADSGVEICEKANMTANLLVGDFDSASYDRLSNYYCAKNAEIIKLNPIKDDTDTEFAINCAIERGYNKIILIGGVGSRLDHSLANVFMMEKCHENNCELIICDDNNILHYLSNGTLVVKKSRFKYVSIIPLEKSVVSNEGFIYSLDNDTMYRSSSRGISNELNAQEGTITVHSGCVIVAESKD